MTLEILILVTAISFGIVGLGFSWLFHRNAKYNRYILEFLGKQVEDLEESLTVSREKLETGNRRISDQSRRVAWLESRIRQPRLLKEEVKKEEVLDAAVIAPKSSMTERRHRVLTLASRGQDSRKIASTLGMLPGEVELIINLNRVAV